MYAGEIVELAPTDEFFEHPRHPYSRAYPFNPRRWARQSHLNVIPGRPPDLTQPVAVVRSPRAARR